MSQFGETPTEGDGLKINGLTFTPVFINGQIVVISDQLPVKTRGGKFVHCFPMEERDQLDPRIVHKTLVVSQHMFDSIMSDGELEQFRLDRVT